MLTRTSRAQISSPNFSHIPPSPPYTHMRAATSRTLQAPPNFSPSSRPTPHNGLASSHLRRNPRSSSAVWVRHVHKSAASKPSARLTTT
ncbi:hypothetical protein IG631_08845 [Alternaria alternata]|nr:hypothetical protein IG631_08845 [Alternaria alternata]